MVRTEADYRKMLVVQENPFRKIGSREIDPPHSRQQKKAQDID
ncbi:MAG: hypothetical protein WA460_06225 [Nitrososphaeraceae archaeon]